MNKKLAFLCKSMVAYTLLGANASFAQVQADAPVVPNTGQGVEDIVVTAQRRSERLERTPVAVTALSADTLRAQSVKNFADIARSVPGLSISGSSTTAPGASLPVVYIRGIGQQDPSIFQDPGVGIYVDGVYVARSAGAAIDLPDVGQVEVLRGPQGTLFGKNAVGGAINITTRKLADTLTASADVTLGNYDLVNARGYISGPLAPTISGSLAFDFRDQDGYIDRLAYPSGQKIGEQGRQRHRSARAKLRFEPSTALSIELSGDYTRYRDTTAPGVATLYPPTAIYTLWNNFVGIPSGNPWTQANTNTGNRYTSFANGPNFADDDIWGVGANITYQLGDVTARSITAYRHVVEAYSRDSDGSPANYFAATGSHRLSQFSQEFQLFGKAFDQKLDWIGGLYYLSEHGQQEDLAIVAPGLYTATLNPAFELGRQYNVDAKTKSYAAFGQLTFNITDQLGVIAGLRYSNEEKDNLVNVLGTESGVLYIPDTRLKDRFSAWTPKFGLQFQATPDIMLYASATRGFKSGGFNGRANTLSSLTQFKPEYVWSYELGFKATMFDRRLRINAAAYQMNYTDIQLAYFVLTTGGVVNSISNVAAARLRGAELEVTAVPVQGLQIGGSASYNTNDYTQIQPGAQVVKGNKIPYVPMWQASAFLQYTAELSNGSQIIPRVDYSYRSKSFAVISNSPASELNANGLVNARLTYRTPSKRWSLAGYVTNLTNRYYFTSAQDNTTASLLYRLVGRPREFGVTLSFGL